MKIVHIAALHLAKDSRIFHKECCTLAAAGHEVHLFVKEPDAESESGVTFHSLAATTPSRWFVARLLSYAWSQLVNLRRVHRLRADVYHIHEILLIPLAILLRMRGCRVIYDVHEDAPRQALAYGRNVGKPWLGYIYKVVYTVFEWCAKLLFNRFVAATPQIAAHFPAKRTVTVQNFVLASEMDELIRRSAETGYLDREHIVVYLGGLFRIRGIVELVNAMELLDQPPESKLVLAGQFSPLSLQQEVEVLAGWQAVDFRGYLSRDQVIDALVSSRIGVVTIHPTPQYVVSWPIKLFEYMAAGIPIIASDFPMWREVFGPIGCIRFVDPLAPQQIAAAVTELLENPEQAESMGRLGQAAVRERFCWDTEADKLLALYQSLDKGR